MRVSVILPAAGLGTRMKAGAAEPAPARKQFLMLEGVPVLLHTIRKFVAAPMVNEVVVALRAEDMAWAGEQIAAEKYTKPVRVVLGGETRQQSVENALASLAPETDIVAVHDAVRPFIELKTIAEVIATAAETGAAIVAIGPVDTVKQVYRKAITGTLNRAQIVLAQTPQVFRAAVLREAFASAREEGFIGTDEASLVERLENTEVSVVAGSDRNIKLTRPSDLELARLFLREEAERRGA
jgi:2-C-methyl-D-erythritol 4-phosphate cytidylyltransferase